MKTHNVVNNAVWAAAISLVLSAAAFAEVQAKGDLLKVQPVAVYHAARGSRLAETLAQLAQRSGISFKINTDLSKDLVQQSLAADNWNTAIKSLLAGYNYSTINVGDQIKTVIVIGRSNAATGTPAAPQALTANTDELIVINAKVRPLPPKYKDFPAGSVTAIDLPVDKMMKIDDDSTVTLDLPMGQFDVAHDHTVTEPDGSKTWVGYLQNEGEGYRVYLSQGAAGTMGMMTAPDGTYNIESSNNGIYLVDTAKLQHAGFDNDQITPPDAISNQLALNAESMNATQTEIDQLQAAVDAAKKALDAANAEVTKYTDLLAQYTTQLNAAANSASTLAAATAAKNTAAKALTEATTAKNSATAALTAATAARNKVTAALTTATNAKNNAQLAYDTKNNAVTNLKTALDKAIAEKAAAQSLMNDALAAKNAANAKMQADQSAKTEAANVLKAATSAKTKAQSAVTTANAALSKAQNALNAAHTAQATANSQYSNAKAANAKTTASAAVAKANTTASDAQAKYDAAVATLNTANAALAAATDNYNAAAANAQTANANYQASSAAYKTASSAYTAASAAYNKAASTANSANTAYTAAVNTTVTLQTALNKAIANYNSAAVANSTANAGFDAATAALASATTRFNNAVTDLAAATANYNSALAGSKTNTSALQATINATKATLDQKTAAAQTAKTNYDQALTALNTAKAGGIDSGNNAGGGGTSTGPVVDVMMLYTTVGQTADYAKQRIALLTTASNQAYKDSGINMTLRVVYTEPTNYSESVSNSQALDDLANDRTVFAGVAAKRAQYGADLVFLFRPLYAQTHGSCGTTYLEFANGSAANKWLGYGTIGDGSSKDAQKGYYCAINTYTHEIGHSLGLVHDREYSNTSGVFYYSYAWGNQGSFGTIMSYKAPVIMYFSAPALTTQCKGDPCGYPESDSARSSDQAKSVNYTAPIIANFMPATVAAPILN
jgi:hypothetical protein